MFLFFLLYHRTVLTFVFSGVSACRGRGGGLRMHTYQVGRSSPAPEGTGGEGANGLDAAAGVKNMDPGSEYIGCSPRKGVALRGK